MRRRPERRSGRRRRNFAATTSQDAGWDTVKAKRGICAPFGPLYRRIGANTKRCAPGEALRYAGFRWKPRRLDSSDRPRRGRRSLPSPERYAQAPESKRGRGGSSPNSADFPRSASNFGRKWAGLAGVRYPCVSAESKLWLISFAPIFPRGSG